jgi:hypothetical protein
VLFADVRGSTALAEQLGPGEFTRRINRFYRVASRAPLIGPGRSYDGPQRRPSVTPTA